MPGPLQSSWRKQKGIAPVIYTEEKKKMDRRTFFKMAGAGAGALLVVPKIATAVFVEPESKTPEIPTPHKPNYEVGHIYRGNTQIAAVANCNISIENPMINVTSRDMMGGYLEWAPQGPVEITISGDMLNLTSMSPHDMIMDDSMLRIILAYPGGEGKIDAEGMIVSTAVSGSFMNEKLVCSFEFRVTGNPILIIK